MARKNGENILTIHIFKLKQTIYTQTDDDFFFYVAKLPFVADLAVHWLASDLPVASPNWGCVRCLLL